MRILELSCIITLSGFQRTAQSLTSDQSRPPILENLEKSLLSSKDKPLRDLYL